MTRKERREQAEAKRVKIMNRLMGSIPEDYSGTWEEAVDTFMKSELEKLLKEFEGEPHIVRQACIKMGTLIGNSYKNLEV